MADFNTYISHLILYIKRAKILLKIFDLLLKENIKRTYKISVEIRLKDKEKSVSVVNIYYDIEFIYLICDIRSSSIGRAV
jgi:hypothetical protein